MRVLPIMILLSVVATGWSSGKKVVTIQHCDAPVYAHETVGHRGHVQCAQNEVVFIKEECRWFWLPGGVKIKKCRDVWYYPGWREYDYSPWEVTIDVHGRHIKRHICGHCGYRHLDKHQCYRESHGRGRLVIKKGYRHHEPRVLQKKKYRKHKEPIVVYKKQHTTSRAVGKTECHRKRPVVIVEKETRRGSRIERGNCNRDTGTNSKVTVIRKREIRRW